MGRPSITLRGKRFGKLVVQDQLGRNKFGNSKWRCLCDCGEETEVMYQNLTRGRVTSCGCNKRGRKSRSAADFGV